METLNELLVRSKMLSDQWKLINKKQDSPKKRDQLLKLQKWIIDVNDLILFQQSQSEKVG